MLGSAALEAFLFEVAGEVQDPKTGKPTRVGFAFVGEGVNRRKVRIAKGSGVQIDV